MSAKNQNACPTNNTLTRTSKRQRCINALKTAKSEHSKYLSKNNYEKMNIKPCAATIIRVFDGWNNAKKAANLPTRPSRGQYNEQDCIDAIIECEKILGYSPSIRKYDEIGLSPSRKVIKKLFGDWNTAIKSAGFEPNISGKSTSKRLYNKKDCVTSLNKAADILGHSPTREEYEKLGFKPSYSVIIDIFDSFNDAKKESNLTCYNTGSCKNNNNTKNNYGSDWDSIRESVFKNRGNACKLCGLERQENKYEFGCDMPIHHIIPFRKFNSSAIANHISNLIPLCHSCHTYIEPYSHTEQCDILNIKKPIVTEYVEETNAKIISNV